MPDSTAYGKKTIITEEPDNKPQRIDYILIILLFAVALGIRLYLYRFHDVISVDGTGFVGAARKLATGDISGLSFYGFYPVLTWLASLVVPDMELAAHLVSVVMGSLLVVPLYLLGMQLFSRSTALIACIVTVVWSSHLFASCQVATQATYTTLALTSIYLVRNMFDKQLISNGCRAGIVMGLAFLTRPEAFLLFLVMPVVPLFEKRRELTRVWRPLVGYCAVFAVVLGMNMLLVHHFTGSWQLAAKTSSALNDTVSYYLKKTDLNHVPGIAPIGYLDFIMKYPDLFLTNPLNNLKKMFETILPVYLWVLALIGFLAGGLLKERLYNRLFLLCSFASLGVIVVFYYISDGYVQPFLPILFLWCAEGGCFTERFMASFLPEGIHKVFERFIRIAPVVLIASFIYALLILVPQIPGKRDLSTYTWEDDEGRRDHKRLGLILKQYLPPGKIMTRHARLSYYSGHEMVGIPNTDLRGIEKAATAGNARFLVLYGGRNGGGTALNFLLDPLHRVPRMHFSVDPGSMNKKPGLHPYLLYTNPSSLGVIVYEIIR